MEINFKANYLNPYKFTYNQSVNMRTQAFNSFVNNKVKGKCTASQQKFGIYISYYRNRVEGCP